MPEPSLDLSLDHVPAWDGAAGDFALVRREDRQLELARSGAGGIALWAALMAGHGLLELGLLAGLVLGAIPVWLGVLGLMFLAPLSLVFLNGLRGELPTALRVDGDGQRVWGTQRQHRNTAGVFWTLNGSAGWVPASRVQAVLLNVERKRPETGTGRTSRASLSIALDNEGRSQLIGPRSAEKAELAWVEARDALLPLGLELARRLRVPLWVRYIGWPNVREPIERELRP